MDFTYVKYSLPLPLPLLSLSAVLPDRALYFPTFSHLLIVNKLLSLSARRRHCRHARAGLSLSLSLSLVHTHTYTNTHTHAHAHTHTNTQTQSTYLCMCVYVCVCVCVCVCLYTYIYVPTYMCVCVCVCVSTHIHLPIQTNSARTSALTQGEKPRFQRPQPKLLKGETLHLCPVSLSPVRARVRGRVRGSPVSLSSPLRPRPLWPKHHPMVCC